MLKIPLSSFKYIKNPLGQLKTLIVISNWVQFAEKDYEGQEWLYRKQKIHSLESSSVIFIPVDFTRIFQNKKSHILLYGAGIYWTKFSMTKHPSITTDSRYITGITISEEQWLNNHFNTEPFIFPPTHNFIMSDFLQEFPFSVLQPQNDISEYQKRSFGRGLILAHLVFPFKEPLIMLKKTTESYEEFDSPEAPMRILISKYSNGNVINEISIEKSNEKYEENIPGIRSIKPNLLKIFPDKWKNKFYLQGLRRNIATISKDFAFIGAPLILE